MSCSSAATIRAMLLVRYPQFSTVDTDLIDAMIDDAKLLVPCCKLGDRADLAVMAKGGALLALSLGMTATGSSSGGGIKRMKEGDTEIEYAIASSSAGSVTYANDFERLYTQIVQGVWRNSPRVLGA